jgi:uridine phosphorylase
MVDALTGAAATLGVATKRGLTVSACGFFAPQGRDVARVKPSAPDLDRVMAEYDPRVGGQRVENMEMESSFLLHFLGGLGYRGGAICPAIANRREDTFAVHYQEAVENAIRVALLALATLRRGYPGT